MAFQWRATYQMGVELLAGRVWEPPHRLGGPQLTLHVFQPVLHVFDLAMETLGLQHSPAEVTTIAWVCIVHDARVKSSARLSRTTRSFNREFGGRGGVCLG